MPKQRTRARRKAAPIDLKEKDDITTNDDLNRPIERIRTPSIRKRNNPVITPNVQAETINLDQYTSQQQIQSTADIASNLLTQLKNSGLVFANNNRVVDNNSLTDIFASVHQINPVSRPSASATCTTSSREISSGQNALSIPSSDIQAIAKTPGNAVNTQQLIPPVSSDPALLQLNNGTGVENPIMNLGIENDIMGATAKFMLSNTLPLGFHVSDVIKQKIWNDEYVDFYLLLPKFNLEDEDDVLYKNDNIKISKNSKQSQKDLFSIFQWTEAFDTFMSIYYLKHPNSILALIKYGANIRLMSKQFGFKIAKSYDNVFRRVRKLMKFDWAIVNDDLWRSAYNQQFKANQQQTIAPAKLKQTGSNSPFQKRVQQSIFPSGYCWTYCKSGECSNKHCKLKHQCVACGKIHATISCKDWVDKKSPNTSKSK